MASVASLRWPSLISSREVNEAECGLILAAGHVRSKKRKRKKKKHEIPGSFSINSGTYQQRKKEKKKSGILSIIYNNDIARL